MSNFNGISIPINLNVVQKIFDLDLRIALFLETCPQDPKEKGEIMEYHFVKKKNSQILCVQYRSLVEDILRLGGTSKYMSEIEEYFLPRFIVEKLQFKTVKIEVFPRDWNDYCDVDGDRINLLRGYIEGISKNFGGLGGPAPKTNYIPKEEDFVAKNSNGNKSGDEDKRKMEEIANFLKKLNIED
jgi:hypothetical protein